MIKYDTRDILNKARQLSDLENSDFISYNESLTLLNDAYTQLYQKAINIGDKQYLKKVTIDTNNSFTGSDTEYHYTLPDDFYQLYSVRERISYGSGLIFRRTKDLPPHARSYDLVNNDLVIYGTAVGAVDVEYFPIPQTLQIEAEPIEIEGAEVLAAYKDVVLEKTSETTLTAKDAISGSAIKDINDNLLSTAKDIRAKVAANGISIIYDNKTAKTYPWNNIENINVVPSSTGYIFKSTKDGKDVYVDIIPKEGNITSIFEVDGNVFKYSTTEGLMLNDIKGPVLDGDVTLVMNKPEGLYLVNDNKLLLWDYKHQVSQVSQVKAYGRERLVDVAEINEDTGYGLLTYKPGKGYYISSYFKDTMLEYPNNFFYSVLAYEVAISYKAKQNADITYLAGLASRAEEQYYDSVNRDVNAFVRINNVY